MRIERFTDWYLRSIVATSSRGKPWAGVAIGPDSEVGRVRVNGWLLQAGRVLALRDDIFTITHESAPSPGSNPGEFTSGSILDLMLFESEAELASEVARPNGRFNSSTTPIDTGVETQIMKIPVEGRRQFRLNLNMTAANAFDYRLVARYTKPSGYEEVALDSGAGLTTLSQMYGGTDTAECWEEIGVYVTVAAAVGDIEARAHAETIGEIGCR